MTEMPDAERSGRVRFEIPDPSATPDAQQQTLTIPPAVLAKVRKQVMAQTAGGIIGNVAGGYFRIYVTSLLWNRLVRKAGRDDLVLGFRDAWAAAGVAESLGRWFRSGQLQQDREFQKLRELGVRMKAARSLK